MAILSMTGFGAGAADEGGEALTVELRSVNGRHCEVKARLPRELASLEGVLVKRVKERLARGNVDAMVRRSTSGASVSARVDPAALAAVAEALKSAAAAAGLEARVGIADLLQIPGLVTLEERAPDLAAAERALIRALEQALSVLVEARRREGAALAADLSARIGTLRRLRDEVAKAAPASVETYRERLRARVKDLAPDVAVDPGRLEQEVVFFAERVDVAEELTRLAAHLDEFERVMAKEGPAGRTLEFVLQEIHREVNTTGSKSQSPELARLVVEMKAEVERLREQVANVE